MLIGSQEHLNEIEKIVRRVTQRDLISFNDMIAKFRLDRFGMHLANF